MSLAVKISNKIHLIEAVDKMYEGYWISPSGEVISLKGKGANHHVSAILENPMKFGFSEDTIKEIMAKYEGNKSKSKEELVKTVVDRGWTRLRRYESWGGFTWTINIKRLNDRTRTFITDFFTDYAEKHGTTSYSETPYMSDDVYIDSPEGKEHMSANDIIKFKLWKDAFSESLISKCRKRFPLKWQGRS